MDESDESGVFDEFDESDELDESGESDEFDEFVESAGFDVNWTHQENEQKGTFPAKSKL